MNLQDPTMNESFELMKKYKNEVEEKFFNNESNGKAFKGYHYTDRALLAQNNIVLKGTIGKGSYSKVKEGIEFSRTQPCLLTRKVAVKIIDRSKAPKDFQEKFLPRELEIWPKLNHENIIRMHNYIVMGDKIYMILEHANGGDLLSYIQNLNEPLTECDAKLWMSQICSAVDYLHTRNITHRDLKLENLILDLATRKIKLCDFGFAKSNSLLAENLEEQLSKTYCGSKAYASPEILLGQPYDPKKSDIWALGVICFIFLNGNMPFKEDCCNQVILNQHKSLELNWIKNYKISSMAKHLIRLTFTFEWQKRPSINDILNSEWMTMSTNSSSTFLSAPFSATKNAKYNLRSRPLADKLLV